MARPSKNTVNHGVEDWDTAINDNFSLIFDTPIPIAIYSSVSAFPAAASYEDCIAVAQDTDQAYISDGSTWKVLGGAAAFLNLTDTPSSYSGQAGKVPAVNSAEDALEFVTMAAGEDISREFYQDFSTSEKDMGMAWHDNKKIYSKVINLGALPDGSSASTLKSVAHNISGLAEIVRIWGFAKDSNGRVIPLPYMHKANASTGEEVLLSANNTYVYLRCNGFDASNFSGTAVLWYTKSATGATDENFLSFSTDEQRTGLNWIDGRPIYCKVLKDLVGPDGSTSTQVAHNISNLKEFIWMETYYKDASSWATAMNGVADNSGTNHRLTYQKANGTYIEYATENTNWTSHTKGHAILWYTKTTDEVPSPETTFGRDFQLQEVYTKTRWTDGKKIYKKTVKLGALPNSSSDSVDLGLKNVDTILWQWGTTYNSSDSYYYSHPFWMTQTSPARYAIYKAKSSMARKTWANDSNYSEYVTIYYTKQEEEEVYFIEEDITLHVDGSSGTSNGDGSEEAPFDSIQHAFDWLKGKRLSANVTVTIQVADGTYTCSTLTISHPDGEQIKLLGDTSSRSGYAITAVDTANKKFTIAGNHTSEFPANAKTLVYGSTLNDNSYTVVSSSYVSGNTEITVSETIQDSTADGNIISFDMGVVLDFSGSAQDGIVLSSNTLKYFDGFILKGSGTSNGKTGISLGLGSSIEMGDNILVYNFQTGILLEENSNLSAGQILCCDNGSGSNAKCWTGSSMVFDNYAGFCRAVSGGCGLLAETAGIIQAPHCVTSGNNLDGLRITKAGFISANYARSCYNSGSGIATDTTSATINANHAKCAHNSSHGAYLLRGAKADLNDAILDNNGDNGLRVVDASFASAVNSTVTNNTNNGIYVWGMSSVAAHGATVTGNGTNYSPSLDTVGNKNSEIYT